MFSAAANPFSRAITSSRLSSSGMKPAAMRWMVILWLQQAGRGDEALRDVDHLAVLVHGRAAQQHVGLVLGQVARAHQDALGLVDDLLVLEGAARLLQLPREAGERVEARNRHVEYGFDP